MSTVSENHYSFSGFLYMEGFFCELVGYISMKLQTYCRDAVYFSIALFVFLQKTSFLSIYKLVVKIVHMPKTCNMVSELSKYIFPFIF